MLRKLTAIGFVEHPQMIRAKNNLTMLRFSLLTDAGSESSDGEGSSAPFVIVVSFWGRRAESIYDRMVNGEDIVAYVDGRLTGCAVEEDGARRVFVRADRVYVFEKSESRRLPRRVEDERWQEDRDDLGF